MWTCKKCAKPVYFAERIQSLGFDWHPPCLVCKECGKKLHPGQHAEHAAEPYCHHPCYGALFGPRLFGHGTRNECHGAFGKVNKAVDAERALLDNKVKEFNQFYDGKPGDITCREVNGRTVLEGVLRVHWAVNCLIHLKQEDETAAAPAASSSRSSSSAAAAGVERSRSNSSVNNSGPASDDSDDDEPLWRDESPPPLSNPSTPGSSTPASSTPGTPNPNWPPTPYPTLRPSNSNSKLYNNSPTRHHPHNSSIELDSGPQSSPVLSYTHNAPPHAPISHPLSSYDATSDSTAAEAASGSVSLPPYINNNNRDCAGPSLPDGNINNNSGDGGEGKEESDRGFSEDFFEYDAGGADSCYATMKTRTVRRRKDIDKSVTQSMRDSLLFLSDPYSSEAGPASLGAGPASLGAGLASPVSSLNNSSVSAGAADASDVNKNSVEEVSQVHASDPNNTGDTTTTTTTDTTATTNGSSTLRRTGSSSTGIIKRVSFSQVDWNEKLKSSTNTDTGSSNNNSSINNNGDTSAGVNGVDHSPTDGGGGGGGDGARKTPPPPSKGRAVLRRRPGRRMDKKKVKRRCSINGHLYLRETSSFHLEPSSPPAVVRATSLTTACQLITTILTKYKIEMGAANFALYVVKDNGEQRRLPPTEAPLLTRVLLGPHDNIARLVLCDADNTSEITPQMAQFVHLSLAECRAILRQYEHEEQAQIRATRARYEDMKFYIQHWMDQMAREGRGAPSDVLSMA